jgi:tetratricopeptide (TPR) repeat protein
MSFPRTFWPSFFLVMGTLVAFYQVLEFDFVNFDDPIYVIHNMDLQGGLSYDTLLWAFTETKKSGHWHPLTWLSLALDVQIFGLDKPWGFHLTNLLLHLANTLLLFQVLYCSTGAQWRSAAVSALFAWHPLHVESVAWITERKDVLSTLFWMLTMLAYLQYVRQPGWKSYSLMLLCFLLGLLSKPMVVTLPFILLLWDFWPLQRLSLHSPHNPGQDSPGLPRLLLEKVPLLLLVLASSLWTFSVMSAGTVRTLGETITPLSRLNNALWAYVTYLKKMVWPVDLAPFYPVSLDGFPTFALLPALFLAGCTLLAIALVKSRPYLLVGWLWYVGTLVPVSGRWQAGAYTWADRYTYIPLIGIFIGLVWFLHDLLPGRWGRKILILGLGGILVGCLYLTWFQVQIWKDSETLWTHTLNVTSKNYLAHVNLANALESQGRVHLALDHYRRSVEVYPNYALGYRRLGLVYQKYHFFPEAVEAFQKLVDLAPDNPDYRLHLATALRQMGRVQEALFQEEEYNRLVRSAKK